MSNWKDSFYEEVKKYLALHHDLNNISHITSVKEEETSGPACGEGTCWDFWRVVSIDYVDLEEKDQYIDIEMDFVAFLEQL
ncbi:hypothetical protein PBI_PEREGRIN_128 [Rhodococcus phage Peregrin]|nr:hypothetical protein PBI_PEREGRIN_128 [Rhodococcus phage Peregrin]